MNITSTTLSLTDPKRVIFGLSYVQNPSPWWVPPGLMKTQGPGAKPTEYSPVSFGADREYGPEEGWQVYQNRRMRRAAHRQHNRTQNNYEDTYNFDDSY